MQSGAELPLQYSRTASHRIKLHLHKHCASGTLCWCTCTNPCTHPHTDVFTTKFLRHACQYIDPTDIVCLVHNTTQLPLTPSSQNDVVRVLPAAPGIVLGMLACMAARAFSTPGEPPKLHIALIRWQWGVWPAVTAGAVEAVWHAEACSRLHTMGLCLLGACRLPLDWRGARGTVCEPLLSITAVLQLVRHQTLLGKAHWPASPMC